VHEHKASGTAYLIAGSLAASGSDPVLSRLLPDNGATLGEWVIAETLRNGRMLLWALRQSWGRAIVRLIERFVLPGIQTHYIVRKRFIEDAVRASLQDGYRQVVNVGAGFDSLCWRLHTEFPSVRFVELDHPSTQGEKSKVLEKHGRMNGNLHLQPADLTRVDLETALRECPRFDASQPTLFVIEGLTMYLTDAEIKGLFRSIRNLQLPKARVIFTFMEPQGNGSVNFPQASRVVAWWLSRRAEHFKWGIHRDLLPGFLATQGFQISELVNDGDLRCRYMDDPIFARTPLAVGELACVSEAEPSCPAS
jgi:methyltransferase (TIGR00027 family)